MYVFLSRFRRRLIALLPYRPTRPRPPARPVCPPDPHVSQRSNTPDRPSVSRLPSARQTSTHARQSARSQRVRQWVVRPSRLRPRAHSLARPPVCLLARPPFVRPPLCSSARSTVHPLARPSAHSPVRLPTRRPVRPPVRPSTRSPVILRVRTPARHFTSRPSASSSPYPPSPIRPQNRPPAWTSANITFRIILDHGYKLV